MRLYDYQRRTLKAVQEGHRVHRRILVVGPTGCGKGSMAAHLLAETARAGKRALFVVHRREIVTDVAERVRTNFSVPVGTILGGKPRHNSALIQVASIQSLLSAERVPKADLLVQDEGHHYTAAEWRRLAERYPRALIDGFTATPQRADGKGMGAAFDHLIVAATYSELLELQHITPCEVLRPEAPLGVDLAMSAADAYMRHAQGPTIIFEPTVAAAVRTQKRLAGLGVRAALITNRTPKAVREAAIEEYKSGRGLEVLINVYVLTEGVDLPATKTIILARACVHCGTYIQIVGRALRSSPGKHAALLIDLTGASHEHGFPTDDREYVLEGAGIRPRGDRPDGGGGGGGEVREGKVLNIALVSARPDAVPTKPIDTKAAFWAGQLAAVSAGRKSMRAARGAYAYKFGTLAPRAGAK